MVSGGHSVLKKYRGTRYQSVFEKWYRVLYTAKFSKKSSTIISIVTTTNPTFNAIFQSYQWKLYSLTISFSSFFFSFSFFYDKF